MPLLHDALDGSKDGYLTIAVDNDYVKEHA
jgi:hypothetical protein